MTFNTQALTDTVELNTYIRGEGTPVLLIHGFPLSRDIWEPQISAMSQRAQVIAPDLRGHGKSPAPEGAYTMDVMARDLLQVLDTLHIERAIWVGHSMGGYITMAAWRLAPQRFSGMGLVATNHRADTPEAKQKRFDTAQKVAEQGAEAAVNPRLFAPDTPEDAPHVIAARLIQRSTPPAGIIGSLQAMAARPDSSDALRTVNVPALVIGGELDQLFPPEIPQEMANLLREASPSVNLVMLPTGHMPMLEKPEDTTAALEDLVRRVEAHGG